ncbi:MAG TPA: signal peptidase I [Candidatus Moranbacteria bacterium]|nr:MAG: Type I signal peptidase [Candidatus Moranbacteria bacterium GW2011_GWC2_45_10]KKT94545.1 MAG: Type I signal peptidase [Parcubacteria group bacterium GW2011_GWC1_45_14]HAV11558.1 signal peptidase I [Candidatus Moranbacteria bacterium]
MLKKILKISITTLLFTFIAIGILVVFSALPITGNLKVFTVQSGSMEPAIKTGSLIFIKPSPSYGIGDIVTKKVSGSKTTVTHRITEEMTKDGKTYFRTKGDANEGVDMELTPLSDVIGKTILTVPYLGYPVSFARTTQGTILLVIIPATIIIYEEISKIRYEIQKKARYKKSLKERAGINHDIFIQRKENVDGVIRYDRKNNLFS